MPGRPHGRSTGDVLLRDVIEADLPIFFDHQLDSIAVRMADFTPRNRDDFMSHWARILKDETVFKKTVICDGHVAGNVVRFEREGEREVGYWIGREYWGRGIATLALADFLRHVTQRPLRARVAKHNMASRRVLEKCGFAISGEERGPSRPGASDEVDDLILTLREDRGG